MGNDKLNSTVRKNPRFWDKLLNLDLSQYNKIIEFGCGDGKNLQDLSNFLSSHNINTKLIGFESSEKRMEEARKNAPAAEILSIEENFDIIDENTLVLMCFACYKIFTATTYIEAYSVMEQLSKAGAVLIHDLLAPQYSYEIPTEFIDESSPYWNYYQEELEERFPKSFGTYFQILIKLLDKDSWDIEKLDNYYSVNWDMIDDVMNHNGLHEVFKLDYRNSDSNQLFKETYGIEIPFATHRYIWYMRKTKTEKFDF